MITQPTPNTPLPTRPANGHRRPALMSALALAEHLVSAPVPPPNSITINSPLSPREEATVEAYHHHDLPALTAWQEAFGGEITHSLSGDSKVLSQLRGRAFDAPFRAWTLRSITREQQAAERQMLARWVTEHGDYDDWAVETRTAYCDVVLRYRLAAAA